MLFDLGVQVNLALSRFTLGSYCVVKLSLAGIGRKNIVAQHIFFSGFKWGKFSVLKALEVFRRIKPSGSELSGVKIGQGVYLGLFPGSIYLYQLERARIIGSFIG